MSFSIGTLLDRVGVYTPLNRAVRYLRDPVYRQNRRDVWEDLDRTRREVGDWAALGSERENPNRLFGIVSFTNLPLHAKFHALVAKAMQLRGYKPVVFTYSGCRFGHEYYRLFGIDRLVMWDEYVGEIANGAEEIEALVAGLVPASMRVNEVKAIRFHGVDVGKHALSMTCRKRIEGRLDFDDIETRGMFQRFLVQSVQSVLAAERFLAENPVEKMLVRDAGYIPNGGIFEAALEKNIDCIVYEQGQRRHTWILKRYSSRSKGQHYFSLDEAAWQRMKSTQWGAREEAGVEREFAGRYQPDSTDDTRRLQSGKRLKSPDEVRAQLGLDPSKKTAIIFSHVAWDAAFFFGSCLFDDFEDWLFQTVKFVAAECPEVNWVVKLHPFNVFKLQRENKTEESEMRLLASLMPLPDHVKIVRAATDINTQSLFPLADYVLTVNGTVGMEFPCYGVPAIVAGTGRYDARGFTVDPATREEYFSILRDLHARPPLTEEERQLARRHFVGLMTRRQVSLEDIAPMELKRLNEAQSDVHDNLSIRARSLEEFEASPSIKRIGDWLAFSHDPDLIGPES